MPAVLWILVVLLAALLLVMFAALMFMCFVYWHDSRRDAERERLVAHIASENGRHHHVQAVARRPPRGHE